VLAGSVIVKFVLTSSSFVQLVKLAKAVARQTVNKNMATKDLVI
jgi:hypothetical protein